MPDEKGGQNPAGNPDSQSLLQAAAIAAIEQRVVALEGQTHSHNKEGPTENLERDIRKAEILMIVVNAAVLILQIVIACIYWGQLNQMRIATEDNTKAIGLAQDSFEIGEGNFDRTMQQMIGQTVAQQQASGVSRDALVDVQRAFVFPTPVVTAQHNPDGFVISIQFENSGYTPTRDLKMHINERPMTEIPKGFEFPDHWAEGQPHVNTPTYIAPKGHTTIFLPIFLPIASAKAQIDNPKLPDIYMWGWARYRDVFNGTKWHETLFCYKFTAIPSPPDTSGKSNEVSLVDNDCPTHNCYDGECEAQK